MEDTRLLLCQAECVQQATQGDPSLHASGILGPVLASPVETHTYWSESKHDIGKLEIIHQDPQGAGARDLWEKA